MQTYNIFQLKLALEVPRSFKAVLNVFKGLISASWGAMRPIHCLRTSIVFHVFRSRFRYTRWTRGNRLRDGRHWDEHKDVPVKTFGLKNNPRYGILKVTHIFKVLQCDTATEPRQGTQAPGRPTWQGCAYHQRQLGRFPWSTMVPGFPFSRKVRNEVPVTFAGLGCQRVFLYNNSPNGCGVWLCYGLGVGFGCAGRAGLGWAWGLVWWARWAGLGKVVASVIIWFNWFTCAV